MMNSNFNQIIAATDDERAGLFNTTAQRKGTTAQNIEKDFWVSWCLDVLFNGLINHHRMLFKVGLITKMSLGEEEIESHDTIMMCSSYCNLKPGEMH